MPEVQNPHWVAKPSRNAACTSSSSPSAPPTPSSVPHASRRATVSTGTRQDITGSPSSSTVQVPHVPWAQPRLAAVRPSVSRSADSSVVPGGGEELARLVVDDELDDAWTASGSLAEQGAADVDGQDARPVPGAGVGVVNGSASSSAACAGGLDVLAVERAAGERGLGGGAPGPACARRPRARSAPRRRCRRTATTAATVTIEAEFSRRRIAFV